MGKKWQKLLRAATLLIRKPYLINRVLDDEDVHKEHVQGVFSIPSTGLPCAAISNFITEQESEVNPFAAMPGGSTPFDLLLLNSICRRFTPCESLEIGTFRGESAANMAQAGAHVSTINLSEEEMRSMKLPEVYIHQHALFSKNHPGIKHIAVNSLSLDFSSLQQVFDVVFVDGDHHYESVKSDTENAFRVLRNEHSIIVWHDYLHTSGKIRWDVLRGILEGTPQEKRKNLYAVSNTLCAVYLPFVPEIIYPPEWDIPEYRFSMKIRATKL